MTQLHQIQTHLLSGQPIDKVTAYRLFGHTHVSSAISKLRKIGMEIHQRSTYKVNGMGKKVLCNEYFVKVRMEGREWDKNGNAAKPKCYNCKHASPSFKIAGKTHHQCNHPKHEDGFNNGSISPWDTLQEFHNTCGDHEFKPQKKGRPLSRPFKPKPDEKRGEIKEKLNEMEKEKSKSVNNEHAKAVLTFLKAMAEKHKVSIDDLNVHISCGTIHVQEYTPDRIQEFRGLESIDTETFI